MPMPINEMTEWMISDLSIRQNENLHGSLVGFRFFDLWAMAF
jgi:hypothetical protein